MSAETVDVPEIPVEDRIEIDPATTAVVVVDMQNDFLRADGSLTVPGAEETLPAVGRLLDWARAEGVLVVYTQDTHRDGDPEWEIWPRHAERETRGWEIAEEIAPLPGERVFEKPRYDGFHGTDLDHQLRVAGIDTLVICGTVANICVHYTAASAALRWYRVIHPVDTLSAMTRFDLLAALRQATFLFQARLTTVDGLIAR